MASFRLPSDWRLAIDRDVLALGVAYWAGGIQVRNRLAGATDRFKARQCLFMACGTIGPWRRQDFADRPESGNPRARPPKAVIQAREETRRLREMFRALKVTMK